MNDTTIIKTISNVHSAIIDLLIFIFVTLFAIYFTLHIGLKLDKFILPGLKIEKLYIKWDEKISVNIDSIKITKSNTKSNFDVSDIDVNKLLKDAHVLGTVFSNVYINNIQVNEVNATFSYTEQSEAYLEVNGPTLNFLTTININEHLLHISVKEFKESSTNTTLTAELVADTNDHRLYGDVNINVADAIALQLYLLADEEKVKVWGKNSQPITKPIGPVVELAHLGPVINPWIIDYLKGDVLNIDYLKGTLYYDNPISFLDTLDVKAAYSDVEYTFAPGYAPAVAHKVDLAFKDRILYIYPRNATFYTQPGGTTWIKIDFEHPSNPLLSVDVDTSAQLTPKLITWLKGYNIGLPFYQTKGLTTVKLAIWITLEDININANGSFSTPKATFNFTGTDINVKDVKVNLNNTDVDIYSLHGDLLDKAITIDLTGKFNPVSEKGRFDILVDDLHFGDENGLSMDKAHDKLAFTYLLQPKSDRLIFPASYWKFNQRLTTVQPFVAPFTFSTLRGSIPATYVHNENQIKAYVAGTFDIKNLKTDLNVDLVSLQMPDLTLEQTSTPLQVHYDKTLRVRSTKKAKWKFFDNDLTIYPSQLSYNNNILNFDDVHFAALGIVDSKIAGKYNTQKGKGKIVLKQLVAQHKDLHFLDIKKDIKIYLTRKKNEQRVEVPIFNLKYRSSPTGWEMGINNLQLLSTHSPLLQEYNISSGSVYLRSRSSQDKINIQGNFSYPYELLVKNNIPIKELTFKGAYQNEKLSLTLSKVIKMQIDEERLSIKTDKVGVSLYAILDFVADHPAKETSSGNSKFEVDIEATNSYIYINEFRRALADKLLLQYSDNRINAQLLHGSNGGAFFEYNKKKFYIYGDNFNDKFMDGLAEFSDFKGGKFSFYVLGEGDKLDGVLQIKDTIIKDYKALNNIFALLNTIPALVTFSAPHYRTNGLKVKEAYASLSLRDKILRIKGFHVTADELSFNGKGTIDTRDMTHEVEISLVTQASRNLSKIPLLGYILVGKDENTETTTIKMSGPLADPLVENTLAKDIGVGSFNIIKRTLTFPVHYIDKAQKAIKNAERK